MNESFAIQGYTQSGNMICFVNGDDIVQTDCFGTQKAIGKTIQAYTELENTTKEYYDKLIELGVIVPPKTQEEMISQMQKSMQDMCELVSSLKKEIEEVKNRGCTCHSANAEQDVSGIKTERCSQPGAAVGSRRPEQPERRS